MNLVIPVRRILHILLLLCLPLYGFAMQGGLPPAADAVSLAHEMEHEMGVQHHHHDDDSSIHYDASDASLDHAHEHSSSPQPVGFGLPRPVLPAEPPVSEPGSYIAQAVPEPFLDGPHKPPASAPGQTAGGSLHA